MIPACAVKTIRIEIPQESGEYAGFKLVEIDISSGFETNNGG